MKGLETVHEVKSVCLAASRYTPNEQKLYILEKKNISEKVYFVEF